MKQRYQKHAKEYNLPDFSYIDHEFDISLLEGERYLLRAIKDKIVNKIDDYVKILEDVLNPDSSSYSSIYETRALSEDDKLKILMIHKQLMILLRKALIVSIDNREKDIADFINEVYDKWEKFKPGLKKIAKDLQKAWEEENFKKAERAGYLG